MKRPIKLFLAAAALAVLAVAGLAVVAANLDPNMFKDRISKAVQDTSGLEVSFNGPISVSWFPSLGVTLEKVAVKSPAQAGGGVLANLGKASVSIKLMPLISGKVETGAIEIDGLELNLIRDKDGKLNLPTPPVKEVKVEGESVVVITDNDQRYSIDYQVEGVSIKNTRVSYDDRMTNKTVTLTGFTLATGKVVRGQPFSVTLGTGYAVTNPDVSGRMDLTGQGMATLEAMRFAFENATFKTTASGKDLPVKEVSAQYTGTVRADLNNQVFEGEAVKLAATGKGGVLPDAGAGFSVAMNAKADLKAGTASIKGLTLESMGFILSGQVDAANLNKAPSVKAVMATNDFNPREVLSKFGVTIQDTGTAKASFTLDADTGAGVASLSDVTIHALGLDMTSRVKVEAMNTDPHVTGAFDLAQCDPSAVMKALGQPLDFKDASAMRKFSLSYDFESKGDTFRMKTRTFKLDDTSMSLSVTVKKAAKPVVTFAFKADALNADRYAMKEEGKKEQAKAKPGKPLDIPADVTGDIELGRLTAAKLHMENLKARVSIKDNILNVDPATLAMYNGSVKAALRTDVRGGPTAPVAVRLNVNGLQVEPLLKDMTGKAAITGTANLSADVSAKGHDPDQALPTLNGKAAFSLTNGLIPGMNLSPDLLKAPQNLFSQQSGPSGTRIEAVKGTFAISGGVANNNDLLASVPPHKITGKGWINLAAQTLDYSAVVNFAKLSPIPVRVSGSLSSPSVTPDPVALAAALAKGVLENIPQNPADLLKKPEDLGKGALDAFGGILGLPKKK